MQLPIPDAPPTTALPLTTAPLTAAPLTPATSPGIYAAYAATVAPALLERLGHHGNQGLVLLDVSGVRWPHWETLLSEHAHVLGSVIGTEGFTGRPLMALRALPLGDVAADAGEADLLRALVAARDGSRTSVVVIHRSHLLDESSMRVLTRWSTAEGVALVVVCSSHARLSPRFGRMLFDGTLLEVPRDRIPQRDLRRRLHHLAGAPVPVSTVLLAHADAGASATLLDLSLTRLTAELPPDPGSHPWAHAGHRPRHGSPLPAEAVAGDLTLWLAQLPDDLRRLVTLVCLSGHLPIAHAIRTWGRRALDWALADGVISRHECAGRNVLLPTARLAARAIVSAADALELHGLRAAVHEAVAEHSCATTRAHSAALAMRLDTPVPPHALPSLARDALAAGRPSIAATLLRRTAGSDEPEVAVATALLLHRTRPTVELRGHLESALAARPALWRDPLLLRLCAVAHLETGGLRDLLGRLVAVPDTGVAIGDGPHALGSHPLGLLAGPGSPAGRALRSAGEALEAGEQRATCVHLAAALRRLVPAGAPRTSDDPLAPAVHGVVAGALALNLALGGYDTQLVALETWAAENVGPWLETAGEYLEIAIGLLDARRGHLERSRRRLDAAAESSRTDDRMRGVGLSLDAERPPAVGPDANPVPERVRSGLPMVSERRVEVEAWLARAFDGADDELPAIVPGAADPRARAIHQAVLARDGVRRREPDGTDAALVTAEGLQAVDQATLAVWVVDAVLEQDDLPTVTDRRIRRLVHALPPDTHGAFPRLARRAAPLSLTSREEEVANLVRAGSTNRAIARKLTVSIRTVESHVAAVLDKSGLSSRSELADHSTLT